MSDHLAKEAARLKADPIFIKALADIRAEALEDLAKAVANDVINIHRFQQKIAVVDEIRNVLARYIMADGIEQETSGTFA